MAAQDDAVAHDRLRPPGLTFGHERHRWVPLEAT
jgi:hypothetical protein